MTITAAPIQTHRAEFTSMRDFLHRAEPGEVFTDPNTRGRSRTTYRFRQRQSSRDTNSCRPGSAGGVVESITTKHEGSPSYAYRSFAYACPIFADETSTTHCITVGGGVTHLGQTPAARMSTARLHDLHDQAVDSYLAT